MTDSLSRHVCRVKVVFEGAARKLSVAIVDRDVFAGRLV